MCILDNEHNFSNDQDLVEKYITPLRRCIEEFPKDALLPHILISARIEKAWHFFIVQNKENLILTKFGTINAEQFI
jgi:hypothetical protein